MPVHSERWSLFLIFFFMQLTFFYIAMIIVQQKWLKLRIKLRMDKISRKDTVISDNKEKMSVLNIQ